MLPEPRLSVSSSIDERFVFAIGDLVLIDPERAEFESGYVLESCDRQELRPPWMRSHHAGWRLVARLQDVPIWHRGRAIPDRQIRRQQPDITHCREPGLADLPFQET